MQALDVTHGQIEQAVTRFGTNTGGGFVDQHGREYLVRNIGLTRRLEDLASTVVAIRNDQAIFLKQVASVSFAPRVKRGEAGYNGKPAVIISIQKQPAADTVTLTRRIETALQDIQRTLPAGGLRNERPVSPGDLHRDLDQKRRARPAGSRCRSRVDPVHLPDERAGDVRVAHRHPDIHPGDRVVFNAFGLTINTMTLGGLAIAIGELVDDAVVDVENILRRLKENRALAQPRPVLEVIAAASQEVRSGIVYATIIIVLVFVPLFALPGIEGRLLRRWGSPTSSRSWPLC